MFLASVLLVNFAQADFLFEVGGEKSKCEALHDAFDFMIKEHKSGHVTDLQTHLDLSFSHRDIAECHRTYRAHILIHTNPKNLYSNFVVFKYSIN